MHDHVVAAAFPQRLDDFLAPLNRTVRRRYRTGSFKLRRRRQQIHRAIRVKVFSFARHGRHGCSCRRIRVNNNEQVQLVHCALHLQPAGLRVRRMAPEKHAAKVRILVDEFVFLHDAVDPARHCDARLAHHGRRGVASLNPVKVNAPGLREMLPRPLSQAVVAG